MPDIKIVPIVHSTPTQVFISYFKPQWINQMQARLGNGASAANVSRVLRNLWLKQYDVQHGIEPDLNSALVVIALTAKTVCRT